jgi:Tol biopolymer transport system component
MWQPVAGMSMLRSGRTPIPLGLLLLAATIAAIAAGGATQRVTAGGAQQQTGSTAPTARSQSLTAWTPDASDLLFASGRDGNSEIYLRRSGQSEWVNLTNHPAVDNWPVWSPDGTRIAFQSNRAGNLGR